MQNFRDFVSDAVNEPSGTSAEIVSMTPSQAVKAAAPAPSMWDSVESDVADTSARTSATRTRQDADSAGAGGRFPVGWLVVFDGPDVGNHFAVGAGLWSLRATDNGRFALEQGNALAEQNAIAAIVYDADQNSFFVAAARNAVVALNDVPLLRTESFEDGHTLSTGGARLLFRTLCDETFNWKTGLSTVSHRARVRTQPSSPRAVK